MYTAYGKRINISKYKNEIKFIMPKNNNKPVKVLQNQNLQGNKNNNLYNQQSKEEEKKKPVGNVGNKRKIYTKRNISLYKTNSIKNNNINNNYQNKQISNQISINEQINNLNNFQPLAQTYKEEKNNNISNKNASVFSRKLKNNILPSTKKQFRYNNGTIGLVNIGNTCYLNSALQNLKNSYSLTLYLLSNYLSYNPQGFTFKYCELLANLINQDTYQCIEPREFFYKLCDVAPMFRFGQQNDSNFCIIYILNLLEKETKYKNFDCSGLLQKMQNSSKFSYDEKNKFNSFIKKIYERRNSFIIENFYGFQQDLYICNNKNCKNISFNFQGISVLNLSIMNNNNSPIYSLEKAIKYYQYGQTHLNEQSFYCSKCSKNKIITQSVIISLPKILIINFKRIGENDFYNHNVEIPMILEMDKLLEKSIDFENECKYELTGFIKHIGGANSGHNIAICRNFFDNIWYVYDDSRVAALNNSIYGNYNKENNPDTTNGFLFFYKKYDVNITESEKNLIISKSAELRK